MELRQYMQIAIKEAEESLREGNNGFGAVIVRDGNIIASSHDQEDTLQDSTSHAELNVIREASRILGKDLSGCMLISTHEPCPMCASAIVWSKISEIAFGYSIHEACRQGRRRIALPCAEVFDRADAAIGITEGIMQKECAVLYREDVRCEIEKLRNADDRMLDMLNADSTCRRTKWFGENRGNFAFLSGDILDSAYRLLLARFKITPEEAPVVKRTEDQIVFHSKNFCPTLEACRILGLDTRHVCRKLNEDATDALVKQVNGRLHFSRNYYKLRPYTGYCEEMITLSVE